MDVSIQVQQSPLTLMLPQYPTPTPQAPSSPLSTATPGRSEAAGLRKRAILRVA
ncbi:hypothetical protein [Actinomadura bangladeshensis]|uniref:Uncharacterized protein n=1 Tax=Actinomadura bangladeshensis TaxID=453573 RepID=A0A6L9QUC7_9ACTN|nr:hypothetical protein [Actinomadura bangladeshensis]NEA29089.1 hypothetical protein [Actinomadura bangladeshensis]